MQVAVLPYVIWVLRGSHPHNDALLREFNFIIQLSGRPFQISALLKHTVLQRLFWATLQSSSGADKAVSGDVMHHLSVTTDLLIWVHLDLMVLTQERRSSRLKVYCLFRTNNSTSDTTVTVTCSLSLFCKIDHSLFQGHRGHWCPVGAKKNRLQKNARKYNNSNC